MRKTIQTISDKILREREIWLDLKHKNLKTNSSTQEHIKTLIDYNSKRRYNIQTLFEITNYSLEFINRALGKC